MINVNKHGVILNKRNLDFEIEGVLNPAVYFDGTIIHFFYRAVAKQNRSTIGYCKMSDPFTIIEQYDFPVIVPEHEYEKHGVEDPRIVKIDDLFYLSYCAYDGNNAFGALATSSDLKKFDKKGIMVPQIEGDAFRDLLDCSEFINDKYCHMHMSNNLIWDKNLIFFPSAFKRSSTNESTSFSSEVISSEV